MATANRTSPARGKAGAETRAGRCDWIGAGLSLLGSAGIEAVRVEPLAVMLGVTKGSFYWHFKDRDALHVAMLEAWRAGTTANAIERIEKESTGKGERLKRLIGMVARNTRLARLEVAIRVWAKSDDRVAKTLAEVDKQRVDYLVMLLRDAGIDTRIARLRAQIVYLTLIGGFFTEIGKSTASDEALWLEVERLIARPS